MTNKEKDVLQIDLEQYLGTYLSTSHPEMIWEKLEEPNWAPWLAASPEGLQGRGETFPAGQIVLQSSEGKDGGQPIASLSLNQINWDGELVHLPTWDEVAGEPTDYSQTYQPDGNTLVLMSMNIAPEWQGNRLPSLMVGQAQKLAQELGVVHLLGSFRPSGFGKAKAEMGFDLDFWEYCQMKKPGTDKPLDPWLRSLSWVGLEPLAVDTQAMVIPVSLEEFYGYQANYKPQLWKEVAAGVWECGEVGTWTVDPENGLAVYQESNLWGKLPLE